MTQHRDRVQIERAVAALRRGGLVAYPTDTVYGLAARASDDRAVEKLFEAKSRPRDQYLPLLIPSMDHVSMLVHNLPGSARRLMRAFWPGALTIVLRKSDGFHSNAVGDTVGVRVPDHDIPRELARLLGEPITGTSANVSGEPEALTAGDVRSQLGQQVDFVIDGGTCEGGGPSTVIDCTVDPPRIVREGALGREEIERMSGVTLAEA